MKSRDMLLSHVFCVFSPGDPFDPKPINGPMARTLAVYWTEWGSHG